MTATTTSSTTLSRKTRIGEFSYPWLLTLGVVLLMTVSLTESAKGSCRAHKRCCDGQDPDCQIQSSFPNPLQMLEQGEDVEEPCFCDHGCLDMGDCCPDFKDYCGGKIFHSFFNSNIPQVWPDLKEFEGGKEQSIFMECLLYCMGKKSSVHSDGAEQWGRILSPKVRYWLCE